MALTEYPTDTFKVWVEFDGFGDPKRASWGVHAPVSSVIQIETPDISTARRAAAALKATIRTRYNPSPILGACLSGEY